MFRASLDDQVSHFIEEASQPRGLNQLLDVACRISGANLCLKVCRCAAAGCDVRQERWIHLISRHVRLKVPLRQLRELAYHPRERHLGYPTLDATVQSPASEDPHLDEGD